MHKQNRKIGLLRKGGIWVFLFTLLFLDLPNASLASGENQEDSLIVTQVDSLIKNFRDTVIVTIKTYQKDLDNIQSRLAELEKERKSTQDSLRLLKEKIEGLPKMPKEIESERVTRIIGFTLETPGLQRVGLTKVSLYTKDSIFCDTSDSRGFFSIDLPMRVTAIAVDGCKEGFFQSEPQISVVDNNFSILKILLTPVPETTEIAVQLLTAPAMAPPDRQWQPLRDRIIKIISGKIQQSYPPTNQLGITKIKLPPKEQGKKLAYEIWHGERTEKKGTINYGEISKDGVLKILITPK
jgi:hypothetical protein